MPPPRLMPPPRALLAWLPPLAWAGLIFYLSSLSVLPAAPRFWQSDKVEHFTAYAILGGLLLVALRASGVRLAAAARAAALIGALYGASDEIHQRWTPGRDSSFGDLAADAAGATAAAALLALWYRRRHAPPQLRRQEPPAR
jgi:VanZ family protein